MRTIQAFSHLLNIAHRHWSP